MFMGLVASGCASPPGDGLADRQQFVASSPAEFVPLGRSRLVDLLSPRLRPGERLVQIVEWPLPVSGRQIAVGVAQSSQYARTVAVDAGSNANIDLDDARRVEQRARLASFGKMSAGLSAQLAPLDDDESVGFSIVFSDSAPFPEPPYDGEGILVSAAEYEAHVRTHRDIAREHLANAKRPLVEWLESEGATVEDFRGTPVVHVVGPARLLRSSRVHGEDVLQLTADEASDPELLGFAGHASMKETSFLGGLCGAGLHCNGAGVAVGIWENDPANPGTIGGIANNNTRLISGAIVDYLIDPNTCNTDNDCSYTAGTNVYRCKSIAVYPSGTPSNRCVGEHLSTVASSIGMRDSFTYPAGVLKPTAVTLPPAGSGNVTQFVANDPGEGGINWLIDATSATYINKSFAAADGTVPQIINWAARKDIILTTIASGNTGTAGVTCADSWNALCVGNYRYETYDNAATHRIHSASSWMNQSAIHPGQERPHVLGPGAHFQGIGLTSGLHIPDIRANGVGTMSSTSIEFTSAMVGTSFAAPAMLSVALQAHEYEGFFSLLYYPIMRKAVVMAATVDANADGAIMNGMEWSSPFDGQDGTGHPDMVFLKGTLDNNRYRYVSLTNASFTTVPCGSQTCREYTITNITVSAGKALKAALVWNACAINRTDLTTPEPVDFDLVLVQPAWCLNSLHQSVSIGNEVEALFDTCLLGAPTQGTYTAKIRTKNAAPVQLCSDETSKPVAFAWSIQ